MPFILKDVVFRVVNQVHTFERIKAMECAKNQLKAKLQDENIALIDHFDEIKCLSQREVAK